MTMYELYQAAFVFWVADMSVFAWSLVDAIYQTQASRARTRK